MWERERRKFLGDEDMLDGAGWEDGGARTFVPSHLLGGETTTTAVRGKGEGGISKNPTKQDMEKLNGIQGINRAFLKLRLETGLPD